MSTALNITWTEAQGLPWRTFTQLMGKLEEIRGREESALSKTASNARH